MQQTITGRKQAQGEALGDREQRALVWVRAHYPSWRSRFSESLDVYLTRRPDWVPILCWSRWYNEPFRDAVLNEHVQIVRRLLREGSGSVAHRAAACAYIPQQGSALPSHPRLKMKSLVTQGSHGALEGCWGL